MALVISRQEPAHSVGSAKCFAARWATRSACAASVSLRQAFVPSSPMVRWLTEWLPTRWLPSIVLSLYSKLFLSYLDAEEIKDGNVNFSFVVTSDSGRSLFFKRARMPRTTVLRPRAA